MSGFVKPGSRTRYVPNPAGLRQLASGAQSSKAMVDIGKKILPRVESYGGRFTRGYQVQARIVDGTAGARVGTDFSMAHWDEWGNIYRAPRAPLRRALAAVGLLSKTKVKGKP